MSPARRVVPAPPRDTKKGKLERLIIVIPSSRSIGHPPHSSASPVELRMRVGPRALSGKKKELRYHNGG